MTNVIKTDDGTTYQTAGFGRTAAGVVAGSVTVKAIEKSKKLYIPKLSAKMTKLSTTSSDKFLREGIKKAVGENGANLKKLGVELFDLSDPKQYETCIKKDTKALMKCKGFFDEILAKGKAVASTKVYKNGNRACFRSRINSVLVNIEKRGLSAFHEIGHSINYNNSKFWKCMQKLRAPGMTLAAIIPFVGLLKRKKVEGEEPKGIIDKTTTFIKNNVGKLTTLAFLPVVAEELKATARGNKLAKKFLSPEMFKKVRMNNALGGLSYVAAAVIAGVAAWGGLKIRDLITTPKKVD